MFSIKTKQSYTQNKNLIMEQNAVNLIIKNENAIIITIYKMCYVKNDNNFLPTGSLNFLVKNCRINYILFNLFNDYF